MLFKHLKLVTKQIGTFPGLQQQQWSRTMSVLARRVKYTQFGEPADVLELVEEKLAKPQNNQVLVKILAAPINPADINTIQGNLKYKN